MRPMSYGQGGPQSQWDPWKPNSQQPWSSGGDDGTPDWAALAEASETRNKRRRLLFIGGGALATIGVGTAVAMAVVSANGGNDASGKPTNLPATASLPSGSATAPSFAPTSAPPPLDPKDFISSAKKDTAPLSPETLFPGTQLTMGDTVYKKGATSDAKNCSTGADGTLPKILTANGCTRLIRASYVKDGIAVTVGVAVFDTAAQAEKAKGQTDGRSMVLSLAGKGVKPFCNAAICRSTRNAYGRYAYFTISGFTNGKNVTKKDTDVFRTGDDLQQFTANQIYRRGQAQASTAANR
ncbi:membrane protein [Streptomyces collinus]|nr:membrane protein [Streptomyces collinus]UJA15233.1 membrane protein [Streptomyces collinus]